MDRHPPCGAIEQLRRPDAPHTPRRGRAKRGGQSRGRYVPAFAADRVSSGQIAKKSRGKPRLSQPPNPAKMCVCFVLVGI